MSEHLMNEATGIESKVPGEQKIRKGVSEEPQYKENCYEDNAIATKDDFTLSPVITVTKNEATLSKGDMKLQKVTVTEDISNDSSMSDEIKPDVQNQNTISDTPKDAVSRNSDAIRPEKAIISETEEMVSDVKKVSKIPKLRFRAAVNKVRSEQRGGDKFSSKEVIHTSKRRSSIPRLKDSKVPPPELKAESKEESIKIEELITEVADEEFDKIYEEIVEHAETSDHSQNAITEKDPEIVETKFDEIIHAYDDNKIQPIIIEKAKSKIPLLKRKSEQEVEVKTNKKELPRKGSLGRIPIPTSFRESTSKPETKISQNLNKNSTCDLSNAKMEKPVPVSHNDTPVILQNTDVDHESLTGDSSKEFSLTATVTKIPISQKNNHKISSIVLNKHPIRANSNKKTVMEVTSMETNHCSNDTQHTQQHNNSNDITVPTEIMLNEAEFAETNGPNDSGQYILHPISVPEKKVEINLKSNLTTEIENKSTESEIDVSNENKNTENILNSIDIKETHNEPNISDTDSLCNKQDDDEKSNEISTEINREDTIICVNNNVCTYENKETNQSNENVHTSLENYTNIREENGTNDLHSSKILNEEENKTNFREECETNHLKSKLHNQDRFSIDENTTHKNILDVKIETENSMKINESEVIIKYKPSLQEVEVTNEISDFDNIDKQVNNSHERKEYNQLERKPLKYKSIRASQTVDERNEEDIIILKGKVNRVISRLDSIEPKVNKKELDNLPKQSVKSKISLFESNEQKPVLIKSLSSKSNKQPKEDKPRIVNVLLKEENNTYSKFNKSNDSKIFANAEQNIIVDKVKVAYNLKDELVNWEKHNKKKPLFNKDDKETKDKLEKHNLNGINAKDYNSVNSIDNSESDRQIIAEGDDVFARKSAEIINNYKISQQKKNINVDADIKRAKSLAELDLGDAVTGKVKKVIQRMKSVDKLEWRKDIIDSREKPRKGSVSERIALFEGRLPSSKHEMIKVPSHQITSTPPSATQEDINRIAELVNARVKYGKFENMTYVELGTGEVPSLWVGTAGLAPGLTRQVIKTAIELGYRAFDTAYIYGTEREVGEAINEKILDGTVKRNELFIASKLWSTFHRTDLVEKACRRSLETMGLEYFDLFMIHNPMSFKEGSDPIPMIANVLQYSEHDYLDAWFGIEDVVKKGLAKRAGVSNFNTKQIKRILDKGKLKPVVNQVESHPYLNQLALEDFCDAHNIKLSVFGALGSKGTPAEWKSDLSPAIDDPLVKLMAAGLSITPAQLLLSYQLNLGRIVVVKSSSADRLWGNLQALNIRLLPEHMSALHSLNKNRRIFTFKGMGDTHKNYPFSEF